MNKHLQKSDISAWLRELADMVDNDQVDLHKAVAINEAQEIPLLEIQMVYNIEDSDKVLPKPKKKHAKPIQ
nr:hypothetical protein 2 [Piscirickettsiaceae bacterium]